MKNVFLTGASSGIGKAIAIALTDQGHNVWGTSRDVSRIRDRQHLYAVRFDLSDFGSIREGFNGALAKAGHFDIVINNAGSGHFDPAEDLSTESVANQFQLLVFAHIQLMQLALAAMREQEQGLIINITSLASRLPVPFMAAYNAAKAAMASFTMSIQLELGDSRLHIVDLQPADICTEFNESVSRSTEPSPQYGAKLAKTWETVERNIKKAPQPDLVAEAVLKLMEDPHPPPRITVGDIFQSKIAPFVFRFLPQRLRIWGLKMYYGI